MQKRNVFFIDTEFNGYQGDLISIALVPLDESIEPFYREILQTTEIDPNSWVGIHVVTKLDGEAIGHAKVQRDLEAYLAQFESVTVIADWMDDIKYFCDLMVTGPGLAIKTPLIETIIDRRIESKSRVPHHAYYDALANRNYYVNHLMNKEPAHA